MLDPILAFSESIVMWVQLKQVLAVIFLYYTCGHFPHMYVSVYHVCAFRSQRPKEGRGSPRTGVAGGCQPPCRCLELNPESKPLEENPVLLTTEPSHHPQALAIFKMILGDSDQQPSWVSLSCIISVEFLHLIMLSTLCFQRPQSWLNSYKLIKGTHVEYELFLLTGFSGAIEMRMVTDKDMCYFYQIRLLEKEYQ